LINQGFRASFLRLGCNHAGFRKCPICRFFWKLGKHWANITPFCGAVFGAALGKTGKQIATDFRMGSPTIDK